MVSSQPTPPHAGLGPGWCQDVLQVSQSCDQGLTQRQGRAQLEGPAYAVGQGMLRLDALQTACSSCVTAGRAVLLATLRVLPTAISAEPWKQRRRSHAHVQVLGPGL